MQKPPCGGFCSWSPPRSCRSSQARSVVGFIRALPEQIVNLRAKGQGSYTLAMSIIDLIFGRLNDRFVDARIRNRMPHLRILIDRNIEYHALTAEAVKQTKTVKWGPHTVTSDIHGYRAKTLSEAEWLRRQIEAFDMPGRHTIRYLQQMN